MRGKEFGTVYLMHSMAKSSGLAAALRDVYGDDGGRRLTALAVTYAACGTHHRYVASEVSRNFSREISGLRGSSDWVGMSRVRELLEASVGRVADLSDRLDSGGTAVVMELTSMVSGLDGINPVGGFRETDVPGNVILMAVDGIMGVPFAYSFADPSGDRSGTLPYLRRRLADGHPQGVHFVLCGADGRDDLGVLVDRGLTFTSLIPSGSPDMGELVAAAESGARRTAIIGGIEFECSESTSPAGSGSVRVLSVRDGEAGKAQAAAFRRRLDSMEAIAAGMRWGSGVERRFAALGYGDELPFVRLSRAEDGSVACEEDAEAVRARIEGCGRTVAATTSDLGWEEIVSLLIRRSRFEWEIDTFRREMASTPGLEPNPDTVRAMFLMQFLGMVLKSQLYRELASVGNLRDSPDDVLDALRGLRVNETADGWVLDELSPQQEGVLSSLGISLPDAGELRAMTKGRRRQRL